MDIIITAWMFDNEWRARIRLADHENVIEQRVAAEEMISALIGAKIRFEVHFETAVLPLAT